LRARHELSKRELEPTSAIGTMGSSVLAVALLSIGSEKPVR
jgi:hypothetical protein